MKEASSAAASAEAGLSACALPQIQLTIDSCVHSNDLGGEQSTRMCKGTMWPHFKPPHHLQCQACQQPDKSNKNMRAVEALHGCSMASYEDWNRKEEDERYRKGQRAAP